MAHPERRIPALDTPNQDPAPGTREHFLAVTQLQRWGTIQEYVDLCRTRVYFTPGTPHARGDTVTNCEG